MPTGVSIWLTSATDENPFQGTNNGGDWIPGLVAGGYINTLPKDPLGGPGLESLVSGCSSWKKAYMYMSDPGVAQPQNYAVLSHCNIEDSASMKTDSPFYDPRRDRDNGTYKWSWRICANSACNGGSDGKGW